MSPKIHYAVSKPNEHGGYNADTLCGRESGALPEVNSETSKDTVTCKLCLAVLSNPKHWRYRKWLAK